MDQCDPISPDEYLLRRVPFDENNKPIDPELAQPVSRLAFRPSSKDVDGISLFREKFVTPEQIANLHRENSKGKECYVVRVKAKDLFDPSVGVKVIPNKIDALPGHALIPEINIGYKLNKEAKRSCVDLQIAIASKLKLVDIVHWPEANS